MKLVLNYLDNLIQYSLIYRLYLFALPLLNSRILVGVGDDRRMVNRILNSIQRKPPHFSYLSSPPQCFVSIHGPTRVELPAESAAA